MNKALTSRRARRGAAGVTTLVALAGCVTINIYFPAAAAEKAADKIIDEVWRLPKPAAPSPAPADFTPPAAVPLP
jgi:hypothetical protein